MVGLSSAASKRLQSAFRPKTVKCYALSFRTFVAFLCFLEYMISQEV